MQQVNSTSRTNYPTYISNDVSKQDTTVQKTIINTALGTDENDDSLIKLSEKVDLEFKTSSSFKNYKSALELAFKGYNGIKLKNEDIGKILKKLDENEFANSPANDQYLNFVSLLILNSSLLNIFVDEEFGGENKELFQKLLRKCRLKVENENDLREVTVEFYSQKNTGLCLLCAIKLVLINPHSYTNLLFLTESLFSAYNTRFYKGTFDIIEMMAKKALSLDSSKIVPNVHLSTAHLLRGEIDKAIEVCEGLLLKGYTNIEIFSKLIEIYVVCDLDKNCIEKGIRYSDRALIFHKNNGEFKVYKKLFEVRLDIFMNDFKKAKQKIDKYFRYNDNLYYIHHSLLLIAEGRASEAYRLYGVKMQQLADGHQVIKSTLGLIYVHLGRENEAALLLNCFCDEDYSFYTQSQIIVKFRLIAKLNLKDLYHQQLEKSLLVILSVTPNCTEALLLYGTLKLEKYKKMQINESSLICENIINRLKAALEISIDFKLQFLMLQYYILEKYYDLGLALSKEMILSIKAEDLQSNFIVLEFCQNLVSYRMKKEAFVILDRSLNLKWNIDVAKYYASLKYSENEKAAACDILEKTLIHFPNAYNIYSILAIYYTNLNSWNKVIKYSNLSISQKLDVEECLKLRICAHIHLEQFHKCCNDFDLILKFSKVPPSDELIKTIIPAYIEQENLERSLELCDQFEDKIGKDIADLYRDKIIKRLLMRETKIVSEPIPEKRVEFFEEKPIEAIIEKKTPDTISVHIEIQKAPVIIDEFQQFINSKKTEEIQYFEKIKKTQQYTKDRFESTNPLPINHKFNLLRCEELSKKLKESNFSFNHETVQNEKRVSVVPIRTSNLPIQKIDDKINEIPSEILQKTRDKYSPSSTMVQGYISLNSLPTPPLSKEYQDRLELAKQRLISLGDILSRISKSYNIKDELSNFVVRHSLLYNLMKLTEALYPTSQPQKVNGELKDFIDYVDLKLISKEFIHKIRNDVRNSFHSISFESLINLSTQLCESNLLKNIEIWLTNSKTKKSPNSFENKVSDGKFTYFEMDEKKIMDPFAILIFQLDKINHIGTKLRKTLDSEGDHMQAVKMSVAIIKKCLKLIPKSQQLISKDDYKLFYTSGNAFAHFIGEDIVHGERDEVSLASIILMVKRAGIVKDDLLTKINK